MTEVVGASIDVGSNSVHLLVASVDDHRLTPLVDESAFLGLGAAVVERHCLGDAARSELVEVLAGYADVARSHGAQAVTIIGTEPIRRAGDGQTLVHELQRRTGLALHALTHEEEAYLTVVGVTQGRAVHHETLVVDIGGGSSEFCIVDPFAPPQALGLRLGSDRLTRTHARTDPPIPDALQAMGAEARATLERLPAMDPLAVIAVGGTASNLVKVLRPGETEGLITRADATRALDLLTAEPSEQIARRYTLKPIRARILPAGAVIVDALLERLGSDALRVSDAGMREGAVLLAAHVGREWRDRLPRLAHGWRS